MNNRAGTAGGVVGNAILSCLRGLTTGCRVKPVAIATAAGASSSYTPLDIADPDGRFGNWMPGDDPDDWR